MRRKDRNFNKLGIRRFECPICKNPRITENLRPARRVQAPYSGLLKDFHFPLAFPSQLHIIYPFSMGMAKSGHAGLDCLPTASPAFF
jgi:hypothetical protein